jgi:hypothetical protein
VVDLRAGDEETLSFLDAFQEQAPEIQRSFPSGGSVPPAAPKRSSDAPPAAAPAVHVSTAGSETPLGKITVDDVALRATVSTGGDGKRTFAFEKDFTPPKLRLVHTFQPPRALVPFDALFSAVVSEVKDGKPTRLFALNKTVVLKFTDKDDQSRLGSVPILEGNGNLQEQLNEQVDKLKGVDTLQIDCFVRFGSSYMIPVGGAVTIRLVAK